MFIIITHLVTFYKLYQSLRKGYFKLRPALITLVADSETKIDDKCMKVLDGIFLKEKK